MGNGQPPHAPSSDAEDWADQTGLTAGWPEEAQRYFNWDSWTRDQRHDYTVVDADGGEVHVFRSL